MTIPPYPKLTPISRGSQPVLIPLALLTQQVVEMDRAGTWHLQQALNLLEAMREDPKLDDRFRQGLLQRHFQTAGALLGSINARIATFKFLQEVQHDQYDAGDAAGYAAARGPRPAEGSAGAVPSGG